LAFLDLFYVDLLRRLQASIICYSTICQPNFLNIFLVFCAHMLHRLSYALLYGHKQFSK
jgi:hypothetical protein